MTVSVSTTVTVTINGTKHELSAAEARQLMTQLQTALAAPAPSIFDELVKRREIGDRPPPFGGPRYDPMLLVGQNDGAREVNLRSEPVYGVRQ
jgi:hypothetical protein